MICSRCLKVLSSELKATGAEVTEIELGKVVVRYDPKLIDTEFIRDIIYHNEFEIVSDKATILAEQTKRWIINFVWSTDLRGSLSEFLAEKIGANYQKLSKNFSSVTGSTIERYAIAVKTERVKEYLEHDHLTASEIAYALGYQNVSALSRQFKKETGVTLTDYRKSDQFSRTPLDKI